MGQGQEEHSGAEQTYAADIHTEAFTHQERNTCAD
jgi:hypothetical protein